MKILLTGASGFIGSALASRLCDSNVDLHVIARPNAQVHSIVKGAHTHPYAGSIDELITALDKARPDIVVHLASLFFVEHAPRNVISLIESNILFGCQLLEAMRCVGIQRFLNTGTSWQHYETDLVRPANLYAATKQAFAALLDYYHDAYNISQVTLKLADTYGPNDRRRKIINLLISAAFSGEQLDMSPGDQILDLTYIDDVIDVYQNAIALLYSSKEEISAQYSVSGSRHPLRDVVAIVGEVTGHRIRANFGGRLYRRREVMIPSRGAAPVFPGWTPTFDLKRGLARLLDKCSPSNAT